MYLKVCGLREADNVKAILELKPEWVGFIFAPASPRFYKDAQSAAPIADIPAPTKKVGVFVNEPLENILHLHKLHQLDFVQLHGSESIDDCKYLKDEGVKVIKAFNVSDAFDFSVIDKYTNYIDLLLFDTAGKLAGGNGTFFNWQLLNGHRFKRPFLLSGGIGPESVNDLKLFHHPDMIGVDVNSRFETSVGVKNAEALGKFKQELQK